MRDWAQGGDMGCVRGFRGGILAARVGAKRSYGVCEGVRRAHEVCEEVQGGRMGCASGLRGVIWDM